jgi:16S rRNA G527 N7-methylase RsmG
LEQRQAYLENKKVEGQVMNVKGQEYKEEMKKMRQDRDDFRAFMKQVYDYNVSEKQQNKKNEVIYSLFFNSYTIIYFLGSWSKN